jgi:hypothetical protein
MSPRKNNPSARDWVETITFWTVGIGLALIPALVFFFSFGNVGAFLESLGIEHRIAYLIGPAVDLAVAVCVVPSSYLSTKGWSEGRLWPLHLAALVCGLIMIGLNIAGAIHVRHWRLAAADCVGPMLLIGWGALAPWLWRNLTEARRQSGGSEKAAAGREITRQRTGTAAPTAAPGSGSEPAVKAAASPLPPGTGTPALPPPTAARSAAPARQSPGSEGGKLLAFTAAPGRRGPKDWAMLALPLWQQYVAKHDGDKPSAPTLAALLRHAHPGLPVPGGERSERNIRSETEKLAKADSEPEREEVG